MSAATTRQALKDAIGSGDYQAAITALTAAFAASGIPATIADAKGDLIAATAADAVARVAVGSDGQILTADAASAAGVKWSASPGGGILATVINAKGDLLVGTADDTVARLGVGTDGQVLTADAASTPGVKWAAAGAGSTLNVVTAQQATDFTQAGVQASFAQLGTIAPSITLAAGERLLVLTAGFVSMSAADELGEQRLSIDSGGTLVSLGRLGGNPAGANLAGHEVITGLSAGAHTVKFEYKKAQAGTLFLRAATQPQLERFRITLQALPA